MKKVILLFFSLVCAVSLVGTTIVNAQSEEPDLAKNCKAAYSCDWHSGTAVYAKNEQERMPIASMCKIMTLLLTFEARDSGKLSFDDEITVSERAAGMGGSQVFLETNGKYKAEDLVKSICIASANDSCVAMAETLSGSEELFVKRMNERASELGMLNTSFANCTGLPKEGQYSCAKDVAVMLGELIRHPDYFKFSTIWMDNITHNGGRLTEMANTNKLIRNYQGCDAGKTGFTSEAGFCLAASAERGNMRVVSVVIGGTDSQSRFNGVSSMFDYAFANFTSKCVLERSVLQDKRCAVKSGKLHEVSVIPETAAYVFCSKDDTDEITLDFVFREVKAPISIGDCVGEVTVYKNGVEVARVNLLSNDQSAASNYFDSLRDIADNWIL